MYAILLLRNQKIKAALKYQSQKNYINAKISGFLPIVHCATLSLIDTCICMYIVSAVNSLYTYSYIHICMSLINFKFSNIKTLLYTPRPLKMLKKGYTNFFFFFLREFSIVQIGKSIKQTELKWVFEWVFWRSEKENMRIWIFKKVKEGFWKVFAKFKQYKFDLTDQMW